VRRVISDLVCVISREEKTTIVHGWRRAWAGIPAALYDVSVDVVAHHLLVANVLRTTMGICCQKCYVPLEIYVIVGLVSVLPVEKAYALESLANCKERFFCFRTQPASVTRRSNPIL